MPKKNILPKFPDDYLGDKAIEYDTYGWMERNQKKTALKVIQYLYDKKLGDTADISGLMLDLGCGSGFSSEILMECGFRVVGVDVLNDMLSLAKKKKSARIQRFRSYPSRY